MATAADTAMMAPIVLDLDGSVGPLPGEQRIAASQWQDKLRFACTASALRRCFAQLDPALPARHGSVFFGSGDFHHLSWPLIARLHARGPFQVVVLDNHPDNMRFPFGVHCGSWVRRVAALPFVSHVHVVGITSTDIGAAHAWENYLTPLLRGRLTYWCMDVDVDWARRLGLADRFRRCDDADALIARFIEERRRAPQPTYLSIDKDVFAEDVAHSNWDQGRLREEHATSLIAALAGRIVGSDVNGEVSIHRYASGWKRRLAARDGQPDIPADQLLAWQRQQHRLNLRLLEAIAAAG